VSAVANVAINVDSRGAAGKLREVANRSKEVSVAVDRMNGNVGKSSSQFKNVGVAASQASAGFGKLGKAIGGIVTAAAAFQALKFTIIKTAELETQTRSLKVLTGSLESAQSIIKQLQDIGAVTPFTSTELIDTAKRLRAFGVETDKLVDTTRRLGDVAGATGADLGGIATAFGQIQAKGRLQGEELLQLQERGIDLQSELQKMYGMTGEEFRKALEKGRFSAEAVDVALQNLTNTGGKYANGAIAQSDTLAGKFSTLQDGITRTAQAIGQVLSPALQTILTQAIGVINSINNALAAGQRIQQFGIDASKRNELFQQASREAEEIARLRGGGKINPAVFTQLRDERFKDLIEAYGYETGQIQVETKAPTLETPSVPELLGGGGGGGGRGAASVAKEQQRAAEAAQRQAEAIAKGRLESEQLLERLNMQLAIEQEINPIKKIQLQNGLEQLEIQQRYGNQIAAEEDAIRRANLERAGGLELQIANVRQTQDLVDKITEAGRAMGEFLAGQIKVTETTDQYKQLWEGMSSAVANTFSSALDAAVDGTKNLGEALQSLAVDLLKTISKMLIMYAIAEALGALGGGSSNPQGVFSFLARGFGFRANGGPVTGGSPYIVGERGPELFVPKGSGTIVPNDRLGGGVTVGTISIKVENTGEQLTPAAQKQLAGQVQGIVLSTLANERRSGGML
jgi:tape measure domain-containing protein